jgi:hypothetical protein
MVGGGGTKVSLSELLEQVYPCPVMFAWYFVVWQEKLMVEEATMIPQSNLLKKAYYCPVMLDGESVAEQLGGVTLLSLHPSSMLVRMWEHVLLERYLGHHSVDRESF